MGQLKAVQSHKSQSRVMCLVCVVIEKGRQLQEEVYETSGRGRLIKYNS